MIEATPLSKGQEIAKLRNLPRIDRAEFKIEAVGLEAAPWGVAAFVKAWDRDSNPIGFGADGRTETERIRLINPPLLVPDLGGMYERIIEDMGVVKGVVRYRLDPTEALLQRLEHTISLVGRPGGRIIPGTIGNTVSTFNSAAGAADPVDGVCNRESVNETFATIRAGTGNVGSSVSLETNPCALRATTTTDQFEIMKRGISFFDTSAIPSSDTVTAATLSVYGTQKANGIGDADYHIGLGVTASDAAVVASDYQSNTSTTSFGSISYSAFSTSGFNDITLNSNGIANIAKGTSARSRFGHRISWDILNDTTGLVWASGAVSNYIIRFADHATDDPVLAVTHVAPAADKVGSFFSMIQ
jgi:hypothetical protein